MDLSRRHQVLRNQNIHSRVPSLWSPESLTPRDWQSPLNRAPTQILKYLVFKQLPCFCFDCILPIRIPIFTIEPHSFFLVVRNTNTNFIFYLSESLCPLGIVHQTLQHFGLASALLELFPPRLIQQTMFFLCVAHVTRSQNVVTPASSHSILTLWQDPLYSGSPGFKGPL